MDHSKDRHDSSHLNRQGFTLQLISTQFGLSFDTGHITFPFELRKLLSMEPILAIAGGRRVNEPHDACGDRGVELGMMAAHICTKRFVLVVHTGTSI